MKSGRPFIVTGASASGKTSLSRFAHAQGGYRILPTHTTRPLRPDEVSGLDILSLSEAAFIAAFGAGKYLEPSLSFARLDATGIYYGTPRSWLRLLLKSHVCAMPTSLTVARAIHQATNVLWAHLSCPDNVRKQRLINRGTSPHEIAARMRAGESINAPPDADIRFDTSHISVSGMFNVIRKESL